VPVFALNNRPANFRPIWNSTPVLLYCSLGGSPVQKKGDYIYIQSVDTNIFMASILRPAKPFLKNKGE
jgi:hypothetical protein